MARTRSPQDSVAKGAALGAAAMGFLIAGASPSAASQHTLGPITLNGAHFAWARGDATNQGNGLEFWRDLAIYETSPLWDTVCNYQAYMAEYAPDGHTLIWSEFTNRHGGCSWQLGLFNFPHWEANYREDTRFRCKWFSDNTPADNWIALGDLKD